jgi:hypothetical protein
MKETYHLIYLKFVNQTLQFLARTNSYDKG